MMPRSDKECKKRPPALLVLDALLMGLEVELPYLSRKFKVRLEDDVLVYDVYTETWKGGKVVKTGTMDAYLELPLTLFIRACNDMTEIELQGLSADIALNRLKGK